jgi:hypothetical protein
MKFTRKAQLALTAIAAVAPLALALPAQALGPYFLGHGLPPVRLVRGGLG